MSNYDGPRSEKIMEELSNKDPKIFVGGGLNDGHAYRDEIYIVVHSLEEIDIDIPIGLDDKPIFLRVMNFIDEYFSEFKKV